MRATGSTQAGTGRGRGFAVLATVVIAMLVPAGTAGAATVSAAYGVLSPHTLHATATTTGVKAKASVVIETKRTSRRAKHRVRARATLRKGSSRVRWKAPKGLKRATVRVRVVGRSGRQRNKTLAVGHWKTIALSGGRKPAPLAKVKSTSVVQLPVPGQQGTLVLSGSQNVKNGQVIALGVTDKTPDGLLVRAVHVDRQAAATTIATEPATIADVVPSGELDVNLPPDSLTARRALGAAAPSDRALSCTNGRSATLTGEAKLSAGLSLSTKWSGGGLFSLPKLQATFMGEVRASLGAQVLVSAEASCTLERQPLFPQAIRLATFATSIGPVPIVGIVYGQVYVQAGAEVKGSMQTGISASASASAGVTYDGKGFRPTGGITKSLTFTPPTINAGGSVEAHLAPAVDVRFYGVGGPEFDLSAGLRLAADLSPPAGEPWWQLTAPLSLGVKFRLHAWIVNAESERFTVWSEEPVLAQATTPPPGSSITDDGPSPDPLPAGIRTRLVWDSNTDVDLHTWNQDGDHSYFRDMDAIDGGFLDQDVIPGYGPETFQETDPESGNDYTFGVCQYSGENANVTVDVRDPDGQTRRFTVSLRGRKAAALLTTSPRGVAPYVDEDANWCNTSGGDPTALGQTSTGTFE